MKIPLLVFTQLLLFNVIYAQINWLQKAGSLSNDEALCNNVDLEGNIVTAGYFSLSCKMSNTTLQSAGSGDAFIFKQDSFGNFLWAVRAGGILSDRVNAVISDSVGNIYIAGQYEGQASFGNFTLTGHGNSQEIFLAKLDSAGNFIWAKSFGGNDIEIANDITIDFSGNILITGLFRDSSFFGNQTLVSSINPSTLVSSFDIFILKCDTAGNVIFAKKGGGKYDDRGLAIACDFNNNIFVSLQYSDTITFVNSYNLIGFNVGGIIKLDSAGNDIWLNKLFAAYVNPYDIIFEDSSLYVCGDFLGQMVVKHLQQSNTITPKFSNNIFAIKFDDDGNYIQSISSGSDNEIHAYKLAVDNMQSILLAGTFECKLTDYSNEYGQGTFNSIGNADVFVSKYDSASKLMWARQYGGPKEDNCKSISLSIQQQPIIAGSYEYNFNVPAGNNFVPNVQNYDSSLWGPGGVMWFCNDANFNSYISVASIGNKDIFLAQPVDTSRSTYYYYMAQNNCNFDAIAPFINNNEDTITACDSAILFFNSQTGLSGTIGPLYLYSWSNGAITCSTSVASTGMYYINVQTLDGCKKFTDSIYVIIYPNPVDPVIQTTIGVIKKAIPKYLCYNKLIVTAPDTAILFASNLPPNFSFYWSTPQGLVYNDSVQVFESGLFEFTVTSPQNTCTKSSCVQVYYYPIDSGIPGQCIPVDFVPKIYFLDSLSEATDTVRLCPKEFFSLIIVDSSWHYNQLTDTIPTFIDWNIQGGYSYFWDISYQTTFMYHKQTFQANSSGNCTITAYIISPFNGTVLDSISRNFYLWVYPAPPNNVSINGSHTICPGDTIMIYTTGADSISNSGPGIFFESIKHDTLLIYSAGIYTINYFIFDTVHGCNLEATNYFNVSLKQNPSIIANPSLAILCPGDSVLLMAQAGIHYIWYGPTGNIIDSTQNIYATTPGLYHYDWIDSTGCSLISEYKEVIAYTTPYLFAEPGITLCKNQTVTIHIFTNDSSLISWNSPLSGNSLTQVIDTAGTYTCTITACGIVSNLSITIIPSGLQAQILPSDSITICQGTNLFLTANAGMSSYLWAPGNIPSMYYTATLPGTYTVTVTDSVGCTSVDSILVDTFPQVGAPTVIDHIICNGDSILLSASAQGYISWYANTLLDTAIAIGNTFQTSSIYNDTMFYVVNSDSICNSISATIHVNINPVSVNPYINFDSLVCRHDTAHLTTIFKNNYQYLWTGPNAFSSTIFNPAIINFDSLQVGYYTLQVSDSQCTSPLDSVWMGLQNFSAYALSSNSPVCSGNALNIFCNNNPNATFTWSGPNNFNGNTFNVTIANAQTINSGTYTLIVTENGCQSDSINIAYIVKQTPLPPSIIGDTVYCEGENILLSTPALNNQTYNWLTPVGNTFSDTLLNVSNCSANNGGTYTLTVFQDGCSSFNNVHVEIITLPKLLLPTAISGCVGDSLYVFTPLENNTSYIWHFQNSAIGTNNYFVIDSAILAQNGLYQIAANHLGCLANDSVDIVINTYPDFDLGNDVTECINVGHTFVVTPIFGTYNWNNSGTQNTYLATDSGMIYLTASNGVCATTDSVFLEWIDCNYFLPDVFTPNSDGQNDFFYIDFASAKKIETKIYNRWGELMKSYDLSIRGWDGTNTKNNEAPEGVYYYIIHAIDFYNKPHTWNGTVTLIR